MKEIEDRNPGRNVGTWVGGLWEECIRSEYTLQVPILLVANKSDLRPNSQSNLPVDSTMQGAESNDDALQSATSGVETVRISAKNLDQVEQPCMRFSLTLHITFCRRNKRSASSSAKWPGRGRSMCQAPLITMSTRAGLCIYRNGASLCPRDGLPTTWASMLKHWRS